MAHRIGSEQVAGDDSVEYHRPLTEGSVEAKIALKESLFEGADFLRARKVPEGVHVHRIGGEAAMKRAIDRYRASTNDTRSITTRVSVVTWVTPLIKGYNRPLEHRCQMFELRPVAGIDVSAVHLNPPAIGVVDVGTIAFAPDDPGAHPR